MKDLLSYKYNKTVKKTVHGQRLKKGIIKCNTDSDHIIYKLLDRDDQIKILTAIIEKIHKEMKLKNPPINEYLITKMNYIILNYKKITLLFLNGIMMYDIWQEEDDLDMG